MVTRTDLALLARTAAHLRPGQVSGRARLRAQRIALQQVPAARRWLLAGPPPVSAVGWPVALCPLDSYLWRDCDGFSALRGGRIELLGMSRSLTDPHRMSCSGPDWRTADWIQPEAPLLWRFHLHYWDWAWALAGEPDRMLARSMFAACWRSWQAAIVPGCGDAWLPYPTALRAWSWCGLHHTLVAGSEIEDDFLTSLAVHVGFLRRHLEVDVGGNHLIKNLKALAGLAVFFADDRLLERTMDRLCGQLAIQVLPDGGHFERSPAYHCQVLADLTDLAALLQSAGYSPRPDLATAVLRMREWLGFVISPAGDVPLTNDGYPVNPLLVRLLRPGAAPSGQLVVLPDSGLARAAAGRWHLLADVGAPCPDELPAHAHADTLSCLVHVDGVPLLVDTGTSTYAPGPARGYERSTAAHNTVEVDGVSSTEVWGAFRAARRARVTSLGGRQDGGRVVIEAAHDGFRRLRGRPVHHRRWSLDQTGLRVDDLVTGTGTHTVTVRWHLAPGTDVRLTANGATARTPSGEFRVTVTGRPAITMATDTAPVATGFAQTAPAPVVSCRVRAQLPVRITSEWRTPGPFAPSVTEAAAGVAGGAA